MKPERLHSVGPWKESLSEGKSESPVDVAGAGSDGITAPLPSLSDPSIFGRGQEPQPAPRPIHPALTERGTADEAVGETVLPHSQNAVDGVLSQQPRSVNAQSPDELLEDIDQSLDALIAEIDAKLERLKSV